MIKEHNANAVQDTPNDQIDAVFKELKESFNSDRTLSLSFRKTMLDSLRRGLEKHENDIYEAMRKDLNLNNMDAFMTNLSMLQNEIKENLKNVSKWSKKQPRKTPLSLFPGKSYVKPQARGVVLVIGSWNYPLSTLGPLVAAISAGNAVMVKPSEHAPACSNILKKICDEFLDTRFYRVVEGAIQTGIHVTSLPFDLICFTGSTYVGKLVAKAASANLTPCILELGGKCPTIIDHTANIDLAAKRIASTKFLNCGQTCVAPDYIFLHPRVKTEFINKLKHYIVKFFGENPKNNENYPRLVHKLHTDRCVKLLDQNKDNVIHGDLSTIDSNGRFIPPIVIENPNMESDLMKEEIFGPILPIIIYSKPQDVIKYIKENPRPLAVYYYGNPDSVVCERLQERTVSGAFLVNDSIVHFAHGDLPFGGVGDSGYGACHGRDGFNQMSHLRSYYIRPNSKFLDLDVRYPYKSSEKRLKEFKKLGFAMTNYYEDVMCWVKLIVGIIAICGAYWLLNKLGLLQINVSFPRFQN